MSLLVAVMTAPINLIVDVIFHNVLEAPSGDAVKIKTQDSAAFRAGNRVSKAVRRASVNVAAAVNDVVLKMKVNRPSNELMLIPERTLIAQSLASVATESIMSVFKGIHNNHKARATAMELNTTASPRSVRREAVGVIDAGRIPVAMTAFDEIAPMFRDLSSEICLQRRKLKALDQEIFDIQWG